MERLKYCLIAENVSRYRLDSDFRSNFIIKWCKVIGIPNYSRLNLEEFGESSEALKYSFYLAIGCFILTSLFHSYVALRTLLQPSYAVGSYGSDVKTLHNYNIYYIYNNYNNTSSFSVSFRHPRSLSGL